MAPHSVDSEFLPEFDKYRGIVEDAVFDRVGRPSFFDEAVEMVMERLEARIEKQGTTDRKSTSCAFATQLSREQGNSKSMHFVPQIVGYGNWPRKKLSGCGGELNFGSFGVGSWSFLRALKARRERRKLRNNEGTNRSVMKVRAQGS